MRPKNPLSCLAGAGTSQLSNILHTDNMSKISIFSLANRHFEILDKIFLLQELRKVKIDDL